MYAAPENLSECWSQHINKWSHYAGSYWPDFYWQIYSPEEAGGSRLRERHPLQARRVGQSLPTTASDRG
jgi:hypothetical protein